MILIVVGMGIFWLFWHYFQFEVKNAFRWLRYSEMYVISQFVDPNYSVPSEWGQLPFNSFMEQVANREKLDLDSDFIHAVAWAPMYPLRVVFAAFMSIFGLWALMWGPGTQYRRKFDLSGLIGAQAENFPIIAPFVKFNPQDQPQRAPGAPVPAELPPFAEALGPEEWIAYNQIPVPDGNLNEQAAFVAFSRQLGPPWRGAQKMPPHKQVLLAAFCLKASRKRRDADDLLGRLAKCWSIEDGLSLKKDKSILRDAQKIMADKKLSEKVLKNCGQHGFENTAMLRGLATAREEGGVLAPAQFVWLRAFDRVLWYPLNNLGRQSYHMEALGALAHYKAERLTRRPIPRAKVQEAVNSITKYLKSGRARPIPPLDYSKSKNKSGVKKPQTSKK